MDRFICIHGHFYQPPRENPWLEAIELQDSAYPFHDWNERITAECYAPNAAARILDGDGRIVRIVNNYARISFDFGPTLLSWMETAAPDTYRAILEADRESQQRFSGHGSAIAQAYNHMILPLANRRDKETQILWGVRDFEHRFGRHPEGLWLAETAVDLETLEIMAAYGIRYVILAPHQAARVRRLGEEEWQDVSGGRVNPRMPYTVPLPSGRSIGAFFYDGPVSRAVAFEGLLNRGESFAERLLGAFDEADSSPQLVHIATDGESYGHHHRRGEMALAYALHYVESRKLARLTNYAEFIEKFPPTHEAEILENTSWSCAHGVERWANDCGCNSGGHPQWTQAWRAPLRAALDWLRDQLATLFEQRGGELLVDPWGARDDYIGVILDRSPENVDRFLARHARRPLAEPERMRALKLLELQRHAMLMYTSCGWFFDEVSGIETVQILQYAGRAVQLAEEIAGPGIEAGFLARLAEVPSNLPELGHAARIYEKWVKPALVDLKKVAAHYAVSSLFEPYGEREPIYAFVVEREDYQTRQAGRARAAVGRARVTSTITGESALLSFGVIHFGDHNLNGGVREYQGPEAYTQLVADITAAFDRADLPEVLRTLDRHFEGATYSLKSLFRDEQRRVLGPIVEGTLAEAEAVYRQIYEHHAPLMRYMSELGMPLPRAFHPAAEIVLNADLRQALRGEEVDRARVAALLETAARERITLDSAGLGFQVAQTIERLMGRLRAEPDDLLLLERLTQLVELAGTLPFEVDFWRAQNLYWEMLHHTYPERVTRAGLGDEKAQEWVGRFRALGSLLGISIPALPFGEGQPQSGLAVIAPDVLPRPRIPSATYRLQLHRGLTFRDAEALVPYLHDLGISDAYVSPILRARADSTHGYDVIDHSRLNPALGGEEAFLAFSAALRDRGMGLIIDVVPNHMAINDPDNAWWMDVLENGPGSVYASHFDVDWQPVKPELANKVLLPILEDQYGRVLESGKLRLAYEDGAFFIHYYDIKLPVAPDTYRLIIADQLEQLSERLGPDHEQVQELQSILTALSYLPVASELPPEKRVERNREKEVIKRRLAALVEASPEVRGAIEAAVHRINGIVRDTRSFDALDELLSAQCYRPAYWRVAAEEINYRRFFDVNELAAIRVELPEVFQATHHVILRLLAEGHASGLRIDHPDGLWDPPRYFRRLQESFLRLSVQSRLGHHGVDDVLEPALQNWLAARMEEAAQGQPEWPLYVVAEKILSEREPLPLDWAVYGTTGYDFLNAVNGLFVDPTSRRAFDKIYSSFIGAPISFSNLVNSSKKMIMLVALASELNVLAHQLERIAERNRRYRDFTLGSLTFALREVIAALPVYRTYVTEQSEQAAERDQRYVEGAVAEAKRRNPRTSESIFDFLRDTLLLRNREEFREEDRPRLKDFVLKFQQVTGPVMAKAVEDTAFYIYNRLISLNEVGGNPEQFGTSVATFHRENVARAARWPHAMLATATHDTKRGEDVRARIAVLSEIPDEWAAALARWSKLNAAKKTNVDGEPAPDRNDEYLLYQTLLGAWPAQPPSREEYLEFRERIAAYMHKATKEAKVHTSWVNPNEGYDAAVRRFVMGILDEAGESPFLADFEHLQRRVAFFGRFNSLAQTLLKLASPGVPDFYQGTELWDLSLVDPDNRRPVDFALRRRLLAELRQAIHAAGHDLRGLARSLVEHAADGRIKLYLIARALEYRRSHHELFAVGAYLPLEARGARADHVCAFARTLRDNALLAVAPRLVVRLVGGEARPPLGEQVWGETWLAIPFAAEGEAYRNLFTGEVVRARKRDGQLSLPLAELCASFPVALLERIPTQSALVSGPPALSEG